MLTITNSMRQNNMMGYLLLVVKCVTTAEIVLVDENKSLGSVNLQSCAVCVDEVGHGGLSPELTAVPLNS